MHAKWMVLFVLLCNCLITTYVLADYTVEIEAEQFANSLATVVSRLGVEPNGDNGCCDAGGGCNSGGERCDVYFRYCFRPLNSITGVCDTALPVITTSADRDDNALTQSELTSIHDFDDETNVNPFTVTITGPWQGIQLYVEAIDSDDNDDDSDNEDDLIDTFIFNIPSGLLTQENPQRYSNIQGENMIATMTLRINVRCAQSFTGEQCEFVNACESESNEICNDGTCVPIANTFMCECDPGFTGPTCRQMDFCEEQTCSFNGDCVNQAAGFECECSPGFNGMECENNIDECVGVDCGDGNCTDLVNNFRCECPPGTTRPFCSISSQSPGSIAGGIIGAFIILTLIVLIAIVISVCVFKALNKQEPKKPSPGDNPTYGIPDNDDTLRSGTAEFENPIYGDEQNAPQETDPHYETPAAAAYEIPVPKYDEVSPDPVSTTTDNSVYNYIAI